MDDHTFRVAVGLRLGTTICAPHQCQHCDKEVDCYGTHGISCRCSERKHNRHATVNSIIHRALISAKIPSRLEPTGMSRADSKCPVGKTVVPWSWSNSGMGCHLPRHFRYLLPMSGYMCCRREESQLVCQPWQAYLFTPVAIKTLGAFGPKTLAFVKELGKRVKREMGEEKATSHLFEHLSVAIQRGNVTDTMGTCFRF